LTGEAGFDLSVLETDVGLDDAPMVDDERIGDHGVDGALLVVDLALSPSRITLPPPNFTSSP
jgi:hypothetical protein